MSIEFHTNGPPDQGDTVEDVPDAATSTWKEGSRHPSTSTLLPVVPARGKQGRAMVAQCAPGTARGTACEGKATAWSRGFDQFRHMFDGLTASGGGSGAASAAPGPASRGPSNRKRRRCRSQRVDVPVTLEDLFQGTTRTVDLTTINCMENGSITNRRKQLQVCILPGWEDGTEVCFPGEGDKMHGVGTGDVIAVLRQRPHPRYRRCGDDLQTTAVVSLPEALHGCTIRLPHPSGAPVAVRLQPITRPEDKVLIRGLGMPHGSDLRTSRSDSGSDSTTVTLPDAEGAGTGTATVPHDRAAHAGDLILNIVVDFGRGSERMKWAERAAVLARGTAAARAGAPPATSASATAQGSAGSSATSQAAPAAASTVAAPPTIEPPSPSQWPELVPQRPPQ